MNQHSQAYVYKDFGLVNVVLMGGRVKPRCVNLVLPNQGCVVNLV